MVIETSLFPADCDFIIAGFGRYIAGNLRGADNVTIFYLKFITGLLYLFTRSNNII